MKACTCSGRPDCSSCFGLGFQVAQGEDTPWVSLVGRDDGTIAIQLSIPTPLSARIEGLVRLQGARIEQAWSRTHNPQVLVIGRAIIQYLARA